MEDKNMQIYSQYDINVQNVYKSKGTVYLECSDYLRIIRPYDYSEDKARIENEVKSVLKNRGFEHTDILEESKLGTYITQNKYGNRFVIKKWYLGEECNLQDIDNIKSAARSLADMHKLLVNTDIQEEISEKIPKKNNLKQYISYNKEMNSIKKYILRKKKKNKLELEFLDSIDYYYCQADEAVSMLNKLEYDNIYQQYIDNRTIVHGAYNNHNIIIGEPDAIVNFSKCYYGIQLYDLYALLRKVMEKNDWALDIGDILINEYVKIIPLNDKEMKMLKAFLYYPEKYHTLINKYYNSQKVWISGRIQQKLNEILEKKVKREEFLQKF